jgi:hypothetical protein
MATEVEKKETKSTETKGKGLLAIAEVRMLLYVIPVALTLLVIALLLKAN